MVVLGSVDADGVVEVGVATVDGVVEVGVVVVAGVVEVGVVVVDGSVVVVGVVPVGGTALVVGGMPATGGVGSTVPTVCDCVLPAGGFRLPLASVWPCLPEGATATLSATFFVTCVRCLCACLTALAPWPVLRITATGAAITLAIVPGACDSAPLPTAAGAA